MIPNNLLNAPKRGFGFGIQEKDILLGPWKKQTQQILSNFPDSTAIDPLKVRKIWKSALENENIRWDIVMKLVSLGTFLENVEAN